MKDVWNMVLRAIVDSTNVTPEMNLANLAAHLCFSLASVVLELSLVVVVVLLLSIEL